VPLARKKRIELGKGRTRSFSRKRKQQIAIYISSEYSREGGKVPKGAGNATGNEGRT